MKTVFKSAELPHIFLHKRAPEGSSPGNASFNGDAYYSFRTVIARHGMHKGKPYLVRDASTFSSFTSKVQSAFSRAIPPGLPVFYLNHGVRGQNLHHAPAELFEYAVAASARCEEEAGKARKDTSKAWSMERSAEWLKHAEEINSFFGLRRKVDASTVSRVRKAAAAVEKKAEKATAARRLLDEQQAAQRLELHRAEYDAWKEGKVTHAFYNRDFPVAFRIENPSSVRIHGDEPVAGLELVSTLGARVPLDSARVALRFILRKRGTEWRRNGETCPVGHYHIDSITPQGVIAGCHRFGWEEVDRVAGLLGESREVAA